MTIPQQIGRRMRRPYPVTFVDASQTFEQAMTEIAAAYGAEQARIIQHYAYSPPPEPIPPDPGTDVPLPPDYTIPFFEDDFGAPSLDLTKWTPTVGDPKWGMWPGGLPVDWNNPDASISAMGPHGPDWEYFSPDQVRTGNGCELVAQRDSMYRDLGYEWVSGIIRSKILLNAGLGRVVAKMPKGHGAWGAIWFLNDQGNSFEPDFAETGFTPFASGADQNSSSAATLHEATGGQDQVRYNAGDMTSEYRTFDCEYLPGESVTWWLDGVQRHHVRTTTRCQLCLMINASVASPSTSGWHSQVDGATPDPMILTVKRAQMFRRSV